ncbi:AI-2E family transporter [Actinomyces faecalis]|uniref:AI-2E family transporter n=1 Tax=Actinomyces faecalis TaxID=2722820 RepID=UPI0015545FFD|nr:AI-2E family transporter [Actinomyces faecalis]
MDETEPMTSKDGPRRRLPGLVGAVSRARWLLQRRIARAEARRAADRAQVMELDSVPATSFGPAPDVLAAPDRAVPADAGSRTASGAALASLPGWLVRGGLGAWLGLGMFLVVALVFLGIGRVVPVFIGVFIALVVTAILHPLVAFFAKVMPRYPATFLALATTAAFLAALVYYVVSSVTNQWSSLAAQFSTGVNTILDFVENGPLPFHFSQQEVLGTLQSMVNQGQQYVESNATSLAGEVLSNAGTVANVFVVLALAVFTSIFLLASGGRMWRWFLNELPARLRTSVHRAAGAGWYTFAGYARGTVILALTDAVMAGVFLQVAGIPLAAPLAVLVFIGAFIPMIGAPLAMIVAMVVALASKGLVAMVVVGLGVAGIGQIEGHILQPLIMGRQVSLHPVVVGIAVAIGTFSAGLLGAVVAVPLVSVVWSVYSELHVKDAPVQGTLPSYSPERDS